jgi:hypothetical protein
MTYSSHLGSAPIQWKPQGMRYLGINIKTPIEDIFDLNGPFLRKTLGRKLRDGQFIMGQSRSAENEYFTKIIISYISNTS